MEVLSEVKKKELLALFKSYEILAVYLFGSRADGTAREDSDYDFGVLFDSSSKQGKRLAIIMEIEEKAVKILDKPVDIIPLDKVSIEKKFLIISKGILIFSKDEHKRTDFEELAIRDYLDFKPFLETYRQEVREAIEEGDYFA